VDFLPRPSQKLDFKILFGPNAGAHPTYVEEVTDRLVVVAAPLQGGILVPIGVGQTVALEYFQYGAKISFTSRVAAIVNGEIPVVKVGIPDERDVDRVQQRDFVRQEATLHLTFKVISAPDAHHNPRPDTVYHSRTKDISGSGAQIICPEPYPTRTQLQITLDVLGKPLHVTGEVIRALSQVSEKDWWVAIRFVGLSERDRDVIIRCIFSIQRDLRKRGLI